jgi:hypothetical protein
MQLLVSTILFLQFLAFSSAAFWAPDNDSPRASQAREDSTEGEGVVTKRNVCEREDDLPRHFRRETPAWDLWKRQDSGGDGVSFC